MRSPQPWPWAQRVTHISLNVARLASPESRFQRQARGHGTGTRAQGGSRRAVPGEGSACTRERWRGDREPERNGDPEPRDAPGFAVTAADRMPSLFLIHWQS